MHALLILLNHALHIYDLLDDFFFHPLLPLFFPVIILCAYKATDIDVFDF